MASPKFAKKARDFWSAMTRRQSEPAKPPVVIHDPAAQRPHDLDDPFFDPAVQTRVGDVIANAGQKK